MKPEISVVIPTFRRPRELNQTISSVLAQKGVALEILVIDDCPDGSAEDIVRPFAERGVVYHRNPSPSGGRPALVRNLGWKLTSGDLVHFLDDDDLVPEGHYAAVIEAAANNPGKGIFFGEVETFGDVDLTSEKEFWQVARRRSRYLGRISPRFGLAAQMFFGSTMLICSAAVIRRSCVEALDGFNGSLPLMEDVDFYGRAIRRFGAKVMDRVTIRYRLGPSLMHRPNVQPAVIASYQGMYARYRAERGAFDFYALKVFGVGLRKIWF